MPPSNSSNPPSRGRSPLRRGEGPPPVMTWGKALPVIIVAGITDALKLMCEWLIFFGPALAGLYCTVKTGGSALAGAACTAAGGVVSFFGAAVIGPFGLIMAMAVAFIGWLIVGFWILATNRRIFKANAAGSLWFMGSLALGLVPFLDTLPFLTGTLIKLYRTQIKVEKAAYKKWEKETAEARQREQQRAMHAAQIQQAQTAQAEQQEEMQYEEQAANNEALY